MSNDFEKLAAEVCDKSELDLLLAEVVSRLDRRESVEIDEVIASHPRHAKELRNFFSFSQEMEELIGMSPSSSDGRSILDEAQRSTTSIDSQTVQMLSALPATEAAGPSSIGKYQVIELLGAGTFGRVYLGYDPLAKRRVAIKVPRAWVDVSEEQRNAFLHEAQSAASLRHEHIVTLLDVYRGDDVPIALVYEHIPGPSMQAVLKQRDYERPEAIAWVAEIAAALDYAHRKRIVHRDVKPSNILITDCNGRRQPRVVDFGLALLDNEFWHKGDRSRIGAVPYMSPEQAKCNSHWATAQSDVFSLGVILYEVLCGRSPWTGTTNNEVLREITERDPAPPRVMDGSISPELERICLKAMAKSPADRYTTAADMAGDLRAAIRVRSSRLRGWQTLTAAAAAILVIASLAFSSLRPNNSVTIAPQEVSLDLGIQPLGQPGHSIVLNDEIAHIEPSDRLQINAEVPQRGYLYVAWFRPDHTVRLVDEKALATPSMAIQDPPIDEKTPWELIGDGNAGKHLVVAFTKPTPLTAEEAELLKGARWDTDTDWVRDRTFFRTAHPRTKTDGPTRGHTPKAPDPTIDADRYLGELGTILKYDWKCYYQAIIFRVN